MTLDLQQKLTPHFSMWEFVISQTAERLGIDNTPPPKVIKNLRTLAETICEPARCALGAMKISSGFRCPPLNAAVGGSPTSAHPLGHAGDLQPYEASKLELARWIKTNCKFDQIILEFGQMQSSGKFEPAWIHVSCDPRGRGQVLEINSLTGGKYRPVKL